jgi:hypothetical protein
MLTYTSIDRSIAGGLARLVGTLLGHPSISFSPPGLGLSFRKYTAKGKDGQSLRVSDRQAMHYQSIAIIPELDW